LSFFSSKDGLLHKKKILTKSNLRFFKDILKINLKLTQITIKTRTKKVKLRVDPIYLLGKSLKLKTNNAIVFRRPELVS